VDANDDPNIASDLQTFDGTFGLAAPPNFTKVKIGNPQTDSGWSGEIALDVEWAHAIAPGASILLVEANSASLGDLLTAVNYARSYAGVSVVSMSWGGGEFRGETSYDSYFTTPGGHAGVTFVASAGDSGAWYGAAWPSISSNVLAVGGTSLYLTASNAYSGEQGWTDSGGGYSSYEAEPTYQHSVQNTGARTNPDVAYDADPSTGFYVYDSFPQSNGSKGWFSFGGTSAGAPQWAALIAIADQGRALAGQAPLAGAQAAIYALPSSDFHDVTTGSNGYPAGPGYDIVTGRGSPYADRVVHDLLGAAGGVAASTKTAAGTGHVQGPALTKHTAEAADPSADIPLPVDAFLSSAASVLGSLAPAGVPLSLSDWAPPHEAPVLWGLVPTLGTATAGDLDQPLARTYDVPPRQNPAPVTPTTNLDGAAQVSDAPAPFDRSDVTDELFSRVV
jgi:subtilase family serine protease